MSGLFLNMINMSISASWLVLAVLILRLILKKAPKWIPVLLWGIVAIRLVLPFSIESALSLIPSARTFPEKVLSGPDFDIQTGIAPVDDRLNDYFEDHYFEGVTVPTNHGANVMTVLAFIWVLGILLLVFYTAISYWRLRRNVDTAVLCKENIFLSENVGSPFVLGVIRPRIYLPFRLGRKEFEHIVAHEKAHIRRKDHWWKPLGFLLLTIHWFNPLIWLAYVLLCRDIELACDEKVIKDFSSEERADYSQALVAFSVNRRMIAACPLAFGEVDVKERVKSVMNYRKPAFCIIVLAVIACAVIAVCFLTNPTGDEPEERYYRIGKTDDPDAVSMVGISGKQAQVYEWFDYMENPSEMGSDLTVEIPEYPGVTFQYTKNQYYESQIIASRPFDNSDLTGNAILITGMPIWNAYFYDLTGDGFPEICATLSFGSGIVDNRIVICDYANGTSYELADRGKYDFTLRLNHDGYLYVDQRVYNSSQLECSGRLAFQDDCIQIISEGAKASAETSDLIPMVMVNGTLYLDTGHESTVEARRCGMMDGQITSAVDGSKQPTINDQSNFGTGYGYQYGAREGTIDIFMNDKWCVFATEEVRQEMQFPSNHTVEAIETQSPD